MKSSIRFAWAALFALALAYAAYWQGFYRGADTALCAMEAFTDDTETPDAELPFCKQALPFWKWRSGKVVHD